jgi:hypothetical protein
MFMPNNGSWPLLVKVAKKEGRRAPITRKKGDLFSENDRGARRLRQKWPSLKGITPGASPRAVLPFNANDSGIVPYSSSD